MAIFNKKINLEQNPSGKSYRMPVSELASQTNGPDIDSTLNENINSNSNDNSNANSNNSEDNGSDADLVIYRRPYMPNRGAIKKLRLSLENMLNSSPYAPYALKHFLASRMQYSDFLGKCCP